MEKKYFSVVFWLTEMSPVVADQEKRVPLDTSVKMECSNTLVLTIMEKHAHNLCVDRSDAYRKFAHEAVKNKTVVWLQIIFPRASRPKGIQGRMKHKLGRIPASSFLK